MQNGPERNAVKTYIRQFGSDRADPYYLFHTDTNLGRRTAELLRDGFSEKRRLAVTLHEMTKVNTSSERNIHKGVRELAKWMADTLPGVRNSQRVVLNLTEGFNRFTGRCGFGGAVSEIVE